MSAIDSSQQNTQPVLLASFSSLALITTFVCTVLQIQGKLYNFSSPITNYILSTGLPAGIALPCTFLTYKTSKNSYTLSTLDLLSKRSSKRTRTTRHLETVASQENFPLTLSTSSSDHLQRNRQNAYFFHLGREIASRIFSRPTVTLPESNYCNNEITRFASLYFNSYVSSTLKRVARSSTPPSLPKTNRQENGRQKYLLQPTQAQERSLEQSNAPTSTNFLLTPSSASSSLASSTSRIESSTQVITTFQEEVFKTHSKIQPKPFSICHRAVSTQNSQTMLQVAHVFFDQRRKIVAGIFVDHTVAWPNNINIIANFIRNFFKKYVLSTLENASKMYSTVPFSSKSNGKKDRQQNLLRQPNEQETSAEQPALTFTVANLSTPSSGQLALIGQEAQEILLHQSEVSQTPNEEQPKPLSICHASRRTFTHLQTQQDFHFFFSQGRNIVTGLVTYDTVAYPKSNSCNEIDRFTKFYFKYFVFTIANASTMHFSTSLPSNDKNDRQQYLLPPEGQETLPTQPSLTSRAPNLFPTPSSGQVVLGGQQVIPTQSEIANATSKVKRQTPLSVRHTAVIDSQTMLQDTNFFFELGQKIVAGLFAEQVVWSNSKITRFAKVYFNRSISSTLESTISSPTPSNKEKGRQKQLLQPKEVIAEQPTPPTSIILNPFLAPSTLPQQNNAKRVLAWTKKKIRQIFKNHSLPIKQSKTHVQMAFATDPSKWTPKPISIPEAQEKMWKNAKKAIEEHNVPIRFFDSYDYPKFSSEILPPLDSFTLQALPKPLSILHAAAATHGFFTKTMQNVHFVVDWGCHFVAGIFAGYTPQQFERNYENNEIAIFASNYFKMNFLSTLKDMKMNVHATFEQICYDISKNIRKEEEERKDRNYDEQGTTAVISYIDRTTGIIYTATVGKPQGFIYRKDAKGKIQEPIPLSCVRDGRIYKSSPTKLPPDKSIQFLQKSTHRRSTMSRGFGITGTRRVNAQHSSRIAIPKPKITMNKLHPGDFIVLCSPAVRLPQIPARAEIQLNKVLTTLPQELLAHCLYRMQLAKTKNDNATVIALQVS